jgi:DNA-binding NtrC family response regulator
MSDVHANAHEAQGERSVSFFRLDDTALFSVMTTIMYVDDDALVRTTARRILEREGISVELAEGVADAKRRLAERAFDGIFIDIWLGDGTAFDLFAWLQEHQPALAKRAAFVTGDVAEDVATTKSLSALGCPVLAKPFDASAMAKTARSWSEN